MGMEIFSWKNKSIKKKIIRTLLVVIVSVLAFFGSFLFGAERVGDWYVKENEPSKSIYWYELGYNLWGKKRCLVKLSTQIYVTGDYEKQLKYLPLVIEDGDHESFVSNADYSWFLVSYISSLYLDGNKEEYKLYYLNNLDNFKNSITRLIPLEEIISDPLSSDDDYTWAMNLSNKILEKYQNEPGTLMLLYNQQSDLYNKLGNKEKANKAKEKAQYYQEEILK